MHLSGKIGLIDTTRITLLLSEYRIATMTSSLWKLQFLKFNVVVLPEILFLYPDNYTHYFFLCVADSAGNWKLIFLEGLRGRVI